MFGIKVWKAYKVVSVLQSLTYENTIVELHVCNTTMQLPAIVSVAHLWKLQLPDVFMSFLRLYVPFTRVLLVSLAVW